MASPAPVLPQTSTPDSTTSSAPQTKPIPSTGSSTSGAPASLTFNNIRLNAIGDTGQFKTVNEKFGWRVRKAIINSSEANRKTVQFEASTQIGSVVWICIGYREYELKIVLDDGEVVRFGGFKEQDFPPLQKHIKQHWGVELTKSKIATRGWNWGEGKIEGKNFDFLVDGRIGFQLPSQNVNQVSASKGDVTLIFENDNERCEVEDQLVELRLFVPPPKSGEDTDPADALKEQFLGLAGSKASSVRSICTIPDVKVLVPAGRFDLVISRTSMKLQGKSNDFTIEFTNMTRMYLLHSASSPHMNLVISLNAPLRKGRTPYPNVVVQFDDKKVIDIEVAMSEEEIEEIEKKNNPDLNTKLQPTMSGIVYVLVTRVLKCLSNRQMVVPGDFRSATGQHCFRCSYKADSGNFYPLQKLFIFIPKPVIIIKYEDIATVSLGRTSGPQTKLFEFDVIVKGGQTYSFSSVDRQESGPFVEFLQSRNIRVRSFAPDESNETENQSILGKDLPSEESDDEDFEAVDEDDDSEGDSLDDDEYEVRDDSENQKPKKRKSDDSKHSPSKKKQKRNKTNTAVGSSSPATTST